MAVLKIYKLDFDDDPVSVLKVGEHSFGRGPLLKCDDRRVSRKHGIITVTDNSATITSIHQNPCFYQSANSTTIIILPKNSPVDISDGDKFALLADQFWFKIKVVKSQPKNDTEISEIHTSNNIENNKDLLSEVNKTIVCPSPQISNPCTSTAGEVPQNIKNDSDSSMVLLQVAPKRELENDEEISSVNKKLKKEVMSESEDEDNKHIKTNEPQHSPENTPKQLQSMPKKGRVTKKQAEAATSVQNAHDAELQAMLFSSDNEDLEETKPAILTNETKLNDYGDSTIKDTKPIDDNNKEEQAKDDSLNKQNNSDNQKVNTDPNLPSTSSAKRQYRDRCWYGLSCYRKNREHLEEHSHPGDSDYESDPNDDRPVCAYGDACYRQNKNHRQKYKHAKPPQKAPNKRRKKNDAPKKRTTKKQYGDESSEDDYDLEDPFIADSGSEYEADSGSDYGDSDSESTGSGDEEAETKRLLKEAKRFTKGKKKDD